MAGDTVITVIGNLTAAPELRYTQSGLAVANLTIASTPRKFNKQTNEWEDAETMFLRGSCWREFAEQVAGSFDKGNRVIATGRLVQRSYETKEGEKRSSFELEIEDIGASVLHATVSITRVQAGQRGQQPQQGQPAGQTAWAAPQGQPAAQPQGQPQQGQTWAAQPPAQPQQQPLGGGAWDAPGPNGYNDETPF